MLIFLCPECQTAKVEGINDNPLLEGRHIDETHVSCANCGWEGKQKELYIRDTSASLEGEEDPQAIVKALADELLNILYTNSSDFIGQSLVAVGLVPKDQLEKEIEKKKEDDDAYVPVFDIVTRLTKSGVEGAWRGILGEMAKVEKISMEARKKGEKPIFRCGFEERTS